jgi:hypothetical protein
MLKAPRARVRVAGGVAASLLLTGALVEIGLRMARPRSAFLRAALHSPGDARDFDHLGTLAELLRASPYHPGPFTVWGGYKLNSHGFRTPEYAREKAPGVRRVLALGDSFTADSGGVPLDQMWHSLVGDRLRARGGRPVEVINLGVPGVGPRFSLRLFELEGARLAPDLVLFGLFVGNDLLDEAPKGDPGPAWQRWSLLGRLVARLPLLVRHAGAIRAEARRQSAGRDPPAPTGPGGHPVAGYVYDPETPVLGGREETLLSLERQRLRLFAVDRRSEAQAWLADVVRTVAALDRAVAASGGRLVVVVMPDHMQVDDALRDAVVGGPIEGRYDFGWIQPALVEQLGARGVIAVDLLPAFRAAPRVPRLYRRYDTHWSTAGNALAAAGVISLLAEMGCFEEAATGRCWPSALGP